MSEFGEIKSLQDRIARIEKTVKEIQESIGADPKGSGWWGEKGEEAGGDVGEGALSEEEMQLLHEGKEIHAIKAYRKRTGVGLAEAKKVVERFESEAG